MFISFNLSTLSHIRLKNLNICKPNYKIKYNYPTLSNNCRTITDILTRYIMVTLLKCIKTKKLYNVWIIPQYLNQRVLMYAT